jgi:hypothetical protein
MVGTIGSNLETREFKPGLPIGPPVIRKGVTKPVKPSFADKSNPAPKRI